MASGERNPIDARFARFLVALCVAVLGALVIAGSAHATDVSSDFGELGVFGDPDDDAITISADATTVTVTDTGTGGATDTDADPADCTQVSATTVTCLRVPSSGDDPITELRVALDDGSDGFTNQAAADVFRAGSEVNGFGTGVKTIQGGPGDETLRGGLDNDVIRGGDGDDQLDGGFGPLAAPTAGNDSLTGEGGVDSVDYIGRAADLTITLDGIANDGQAGEADNADVESVDSGDGDDVVVGNAERNTLETGRGRDQIFADAGNDTIDAGSDDDLAVGGNGHDDIRCGSGVDVGLLDALDDHVGDCERTGADVAGDSAAVDGKRRFRVPISCPVAEGAPCVGKLKATAGGRKVGKGKFNVPAGETKNAKAKLTKKGAKTLRRAGGVLVLTVEATTTEPGGVSRDSDQILVYE